MKVNCTTCSPFTLKNTKTAEKSNASAPSPDVSPNTANASAEDRFAELIASAPTVATSQWLPSNAQ